jgi:tRNA pseudouridine55 synthase
VKQFLGEIDQNHLFFCYKRKALRLYEHARAGKTVEIATRKTTIHEFEITRIALPEIDFRVVCNKGTYIRSFFWHMNWISLNRPQNTKDWRLGELL